MQASYNHSIEQKRSRGITDLSADATRDIAATLTTLLADVFTLYLKTKNFHWHMSGPHFRDYHLLLDEHGDQIFAMTDPIAERALGWPYRAAPASCRQRRRLCRGAGYARRTKGRQSQTDILHA